MSLHDVVCIYESLFVPVGLSLLVFVSTNFFLDVSVRRVCHSHSVSTDCEYCETQKRQAILVK
mgnify:CR=1 FL=1